MYSRKKLISFFFTLIFFNFFTSCSDKPIYQRLNKQNIIKNVSFKITNVEDIPWRVGKGKNKTTISQGILVGVKYPYLPQNMLDQFRKEYNVDSWLVKVKRATGVSHFEVLGHILIPFKLSSSSSDGIMTTLMGKSRKFFVKYAYAAVSPSKRFEAFSCPAFNHDKKVGDYEIESTSSEPKSFVVFTQRRLSVRYRNIKDYGPSAIDFNVGNTVKGKYAFEFALYNYKKKELLSRFTDIGQTLHVLSEERETVPGCDNFQIPNKAPASDKNMKNFKF